MFPYFFFFLVLACQPSLDLNNREAPDINRDNQATSSPSTIFSVINVHQGDATLIQTRAGKRILIDAGNHYDESQSLLYFLKEHDITYIDAVFLTHFDLDHYGGILAFPLGLDGIALTGDEILVGDIYDRGAPELTDYFFDLYLNSYAPARNETRAGDVYIFDDLTITVLMVRGHSAELAYRMDPYDENASSMVLLIASERFSFLNMGDLPSKASQDDEAASLDQEIARLAGDIDVLHVPHHGSRFSTSNALLEKTKPEISIISVGDNNTYGHPTFEVLQRLKLAGSEIYLTEKGNGGQVADSTIANGNIEIKVDSEGSYSITTKIAPLAIKRGSRRPLQWQSHMEPPPQRARGADLLNNY